MMESIIQPSYPSYEEIHKSKGIVLRFLDWCEDQNKNRLFWLALTLFGFGCFLTPFTILAMVTSSNSTLLWSLGTAAMAGPLIVNLAALSTRITIPFLFLGLLIDIVVVLNCLVENWSR